MGNQLGTDKHISENPITNIEESVAMISGTDVKNCLNA